MAVDEVVEAVVTEEAVMRDSAMWNPPELEHLRPSSHDTEVGWGDTDCVLARSLFEATGERWIVIIRDAVRVRDMALFVVDSHGQAMTTPGEVANIGKTFRVTRA